MKTAYRPDPPAARQLTMAWPPVTLQGMTAPERTIAIARLASLLIEAAGEATEESPDEAR